MKNLLAFIMLFFFQNLLSQTTKTECARILAEANQLEKNGRYREAIQKFNAVSVCDATLKPEVERRILTVFDKIEAQRNEAIAAKTAVQAAGKIVERERDNARQSLAEAVEARRLAVAAEQKAQRTSIANFNAALALQTLPHNPTLAFRLADENYRNAPDESVALVTRNLILSDTSHVFYKFETEAPGQILNFSISFDKKWLAAGCTGGSVAIWDLANLPSPPRVLQAHTGDIWAIEFAPADLRLLTCSDDALIKIWDFPNLEKPAKVFPLPNRVRATAWSSDGKLFLTGGNDGRARLWDAASDSLPPIRVFNYKSIIYTAQISPDQTEVLVGGADNTARVWGISNDSVIRKSFIGHEGDMMCARFSPDGSHVLTAGSEGLIHLWKNEPDAKPLKTFLGHSEGVPRISFSSDGNHFVSGGFDKLAHLWETFGTNNIPIYAYAGHNSRVFAVAFDPNEPYFFTGGADKMLRKFPLEPWNTRFFSKKAHPAKVSALLFSPDGSSILSAGGDGTLTNWQMGGDAPKNGRPIQAHQLNISALAQTPDGDWLASASMDSTLKIWRRQGDSLHLINRYESAGALISVAFSPDNQWIAGGQQDGTIILWEKNRFPTEFARLTAHQGAVTCLAFSNSPRLLGFAKTPGLLLSGSEDHALKIWDLESKSEKTHLNYSHPSVLVGVFISEDGQWAISASKDQSIRVWDLMKTELPPRLILNKYAQGDILQAVSFSPDGQIITGVTNSGVILTFEKDGVDLPFWRAYCSKPVPTAVAISPDTRVQVVGNQSGEIIFLHSPVQFISKEIAAFSLEKLLQAGLMVEPRFANDDPNLTAAAANYLFLKKDFSTAYSIWEKNLAIKKTPEAMIGLYKTGQQLGKNHFEMLSQMDSLGFLLAFAAYFEQTGQWEKANLFLKKHLSQKMDFYQAARYFENCVKGNLTADSMHIGGLSRADLRNYYPRLQFAYSNSKFGETDRARLIHQIFSTIERINATPGKKVEPLEIATQHHNLANAMILSGKYAEAESAARTAIQLAPTWKYGYTDLSSALILQNKFQEVRQLHQEKMDLAYYPERGLPKFRDVFIKDINGLMDRGLIHLDKRPMVDELLKNLANP